MTLIDAVKNKIEQWKEEKKAKKAYSENLEKEILEESKDEIKQAVKKQVIAEQVEQFAKNKQTLGAKFKSEMGTLENFASKEKMDRLMGKTSSSGKFTTTGTVEKIMGKTSNMPKIDIKKGMVKLRKE